MTTRIPEATLIRIVQSYYDAVDSMDADRLVSLYLPAPSTTLRFNADPPIVTVEAIKAFSAQFTQALGGIKHSLIEIWTNPLKGGVVPVDLPPRRSVSTVTVVSTALPTFSIRNASGVTSLRCRRPPSLPSTSRRRSSSRSTICLISPRFMPPFSRQPESLADAVSRTKVEQSRRQHDLQSQS